MRHSLRTVVQPALEDRWARYVASAMDVMFEHLILRAAGESDLLGEDNADLRQTLGRLGATARDHADEAAWLPLAALADAAVDEDDGPDEPPDATDATAATAATEEPAGTGGTADATATVGAAGERDPATAENERLRAVLVEALAAAERLPAGPDADAVRDDLLRLVRRQLDRQVALTRPLFMSFGPTPKPSKAG